MGNKLKKIIALIIMLAVVLSINVGFNLKNTHAAGYGINNPRLDTANDITVWDCLYFGNYLQSHERDGSYRTKQPIRWRVLSVNGDEAFLLADRVLDTKEYNEGYADVTWETCTLRSWLNGYGASSNIMKEDYTSTNFIDQAFNKSEKSAIKTITVKNDNNSYFNTVGGNNTNDKVFLLSYDEVQNSKYGFNPNFYEKSKTRECKATKYAEYNRCWVDSDYNYNCWWLLRSPGCDSLHSSGIGVDGCGSPNGDEVFDTGNGVRPALHLNLSSNTWDFAGTVSSDGTETRPTTSVKSATMNVGKASIRKIKNIKTKSVKVTVKRLTNAKKYQIQIAKNKKFKKAKSYYTKKLSYKIKKLKKKKTYYVRVRGINGTVKGTWSKTKKVKIKK